MIMMNRNGKVRNNEYMIQVCWFVLLLFRLLEVASLDFVNYVNLVRKSNVERGSPSCG